MHTLALALRSYVEGFAYGHLLQHDGSSSDADLLKLLPADASQQPCVGSTKGSVPTPGPSAPAGFVVYRETAQLMETLEGGGVVSLSL
jgi:hypothetical protein